MYAALRSNALHEGELQLLYAPTLDLHSGRVDTIEVLLDIGNSSCGDEPLAPPGGPLNQADLIVSVGVRMVDQALAQLARWRELRMGITGMSMAASAVLLRSPVFIDAIAASLRMHRLDGRSLTLLVHESCAMCGCAATMKAIPLLTGCGVRLTLDDFGSGYSTLCRLSRLPITGVRLGRTLVAGIQSNPQKLAVSSAIVALGKSMGLRVVAQGVCNVGQRALLAEAGCDAVQGRHAGRPMPASRIESLVRRCNLRQAAVEARLAR